MKVPTSVKSCLKNNMPVWYGRIQRSKDIEVIERITMQKKLQGDGGSNALGNYQSCVVGEFHGFNIKNRHAEGNTYGGCTECHKFSHSIYEAGDPETLFDEIEMFCRHAEEDHPRMFKKVKNK